jgi:autotransporter-associated beta strand protein
MHTTRRFVLLAAWAAIGLMEAKAGTTYTLNSFNASQNWNASSTWSPATDWPGNGTTNDVAVFPANSGGYDGLREVVATGLTLTLDRISAQNSASASRNYQITGGTFTLNTISKSGNGGMTWSATTRLQPVGATLALQLTGTNPDGVTINGVIGDGAGGGAFGVTLSSETAGRGPTLAGANTYTNGTTVGSGVLLTFGTNSTVGGGVITDGPVGKGLLVLSDGAQLAGKTSQRTIHNNVQIDGNITLGANNQQGVTLSASGLTVPSKVTLTGSRKIAVSYNASAINNEITDNASGYTLTKDGDQTLTLGQANSFGGGLVGLNGTLTLSAANAFTGSGGLTAGTDFRGSGAATINLNASQSYTGGTLVKGATAPGNPSPTVALNASGTLGANAVGNNVVVQGGVLKLAATGSLGASQTLTVNSTDVSLGVLALGSAFGAVPTLSSSSSACLALDGGTRSFVTDLSTLGNGRWFLGASSASTINPTTLAPCADNIHRLGGGGSTLTISTPALADNGGTRVTIGSMLANGNGTVQSSVANTYAGASLVNRSTFKLYGANGKALNSPAFTVNRGTLESGESGSATTDDNSTTFGRIGNTATVTLNSSTLKLTGQNNQASSEQVGGVTLQTGYNTLEAAKNGTGNATLTLAALNRDGSDAGGRAMLYAGANATVNFVKVTNAASVALVGGSGGRTTDKPIVPYARGTDSVPKNTFLTFNGANGFVPLSTASDYIASVLTANADGNDNVRHTFGADTTVTLTANTTVNSLIADASTANTLTIAGNSGTKLTVKSGTILLTGQANAGLTFTVPTLDFGSAEAIFFGTGSGGAGLTVSSAITGSGGLTAYATGPSGLKLGGANSGLSGPITINGGLVNVTTPAALPTNSSVRIRDGAALRSSSALSGGLAVACSAVYGNGTLSLDDNGKALNIGANTDGQNGYVTLNTGGILSPGDFAIEHGTAAAVGTLTIANNQGNNATQTANLNLRGGRLLMDIAGPQAHDMIAFSTANAAAGGVLTFGGGGSTLEVTLGYAASAGELYKIIDVPGTNSITGKFSNSGDTVTASYGGKNYRFDILYSSALGGGDGNDIVLRAQQLAVSSGISVLIR